VSAFDATTLDGKLREIADYFAAWQGDPSDKEYEDVVREAADLIDGVRAEIVRRRGTRWTATTTTTPPKTKAPAGSAPPMRRTGRVVGSGSAPHSARREEKK